MSWEMPAGGSGGAGFTCTGVGYDGSNLLIGDFDSERIVVVSTAGAYVSEIVLASAPNNSVQGVSFDTSDSTYWVCHYATTNGTIRRYNASGTLLQTISPARLVAGPNGCVYDAANDRILTAWEDGKIVGYDCADGSQDEVITVSGITGTRTDGVTLDPSSPSSFLWVTVDNSTSDGGKLHQINRSTGAATSTVILPGSVEGITFIGSDIYLACDQEYHAGVTDGNRVWKISPTTGRETIGIARGIEIVDLDLRTSSGYQNFGGFSHPPKAVIVVASYATSMASAQMSLGFADDQVRQNCMAYRTDDNVGANTNGQKSWRSTRVLLGTGTGGDNAPAAEMRSVTHDGILVNVTNAFTAARRVTLIGIWGDDVDAAVGYFDMSTSGGTQAVTGLGFQPKSMLFSCNMGNTTEGLVTTESRWMLGFADGTNQGVTSTLGVRAAPSDEQGVSRSDACLVRISQTLTTTMLATLNSLDADGFTVNKSTAPGATIRCGYLALGGDISVRVGAFNQPTVTGNQSITTTGVQPEAVLLMSTGRVANTTPTTGSRVAVGAAISTSNRMCKAATQQDAVGTTNTASYTSETKCAAAISDGGTPTVLADADLSSFDASGLTLGWTTVDSIQRMWNYMVFGEAVADPADLTSAATYDAQTVSAAVVNLLDVQSSKSYDAQTVSAAVANPTDLTSSKSYDVQTVSAAIVAPTDLTSTKAYADQTVVTQSTVALDLQSTKTFADQTVSGVIGQVTILDSNATYANQTVSGQAEVALDLQSTKTYGDQVATSEIGVTHTIDSAVNYDGQVVVSEVKVDSTLASSKSYDQQTVAGVIESIRDVFSVVTYANQTVTATAKESTVIGETRIFESRMFVSQLFKEPE